MNELVEHWTTSKQACADERGMVASQHHLATRAGAAILDRGGNAIDAAVATALALGTVEPWMCGLGGSGLMLIWLQEEQRALTLDFQGVLASACDSRDYPVDPEGAPTLMGFPTVQGDANVAGYASITVPGAAAGFDHALARYGTLPLKEVAEPAIELAERGFVADWHTTLQSALAMHVIERDPCSASIYLPGQRPIQPETPLLIPGLARTLRRYAASGADGFYRGELAADIVAELQSGGSLITVDDLASYEVLESPAHHSEHRGAHVHTAGDSSGGTRLRDFLGHVEQAMPNPPASPTPNTWLIYANALNAAWRKHNARFGRATEQGSCTSHLSCVDGSGNMVALTHTLLNRFGSGVTLPSSGLLMNNAVSYFDPRPGHPTSMSPSLRINASNMCPTLATRDDAALFAIGASGGNQIMPAIAQVAALMLDFDFSLEAAMHHPRLDASDRESLRCDPALGEAVLSRLGEAHTLEVAQRLTFPKLYACPSGVAREAGSFVGINDPSQPIGSASGPQPMNLATATSSPPSGAAPIRA